MSLHREPTSISNNSPGGSRGTRGLSGETPVTLLLLHRLPTSAAPIGRLRERCGCLCHRLLPRYGVLGNCHPAGPDGQVQTDRFRRTGPDGQVQTDRSRRTEVARESFSPAAGSVHAGRAYCPRSRGLQVLVPGHSHGNATSKLLAAHAVLRKQEWQGDPFASGRLLVSWGGSTAAQEFMENLQSRNAAAATGVKQYQVGHPQRSA